MAAAGSRDLVKDAPTFAQLVQKARDPSVSLHEQHAAFGELVRQSQHIVFGLALASLRDVEEAKDAAQDAFATAWHRLRQLRDPSAFAPWLRTIVATACSRLRRKRSLAPGDPALQPWVEAEDRQMDYQSVVASALERLPEGERHVTVLFYFLGYSLPQIAKLLRLKPGTVGKRLHSARLRIRRGLPPSVRTDFVRLAPSKDFVEQVSRGLLDEYVGEYRFDSRPDHVVSITRQGDTLVGEGGGQRHVLVSVGRQSLLPIHYDGEGRFKRNRRGEVTHFVYYEFGRRLGVARKTSRR
jgi:RNA polymerase sigma-70 factor (ECF subfamily)